MTYEVVSRPAQNEMDEAYEWLISETEEHAPRWYNGLIDAIQSLEKVAKRCPLAPDDTKPHEELRQLLYGNKRHAYRIIVAIRGSKVYVLHVRHAARDSLH